MCRCGSRGARRERAPTRFALRTNSRRDEIFRTRRDTPTAEAAFQRAGNDWSSRCFVDPQMPSPLVTWHALIPQERRKAALLSFWFFLTIAAPWILKPIRSASLLTHLGAAELPDVGLGAVVVVALVVAIYPGSSTVRRG
jgi:hypothetical protein